MSDSMYLARGFLIGMIFGVPAGVIGIMTIQRTLERGFAAGIFTGLGSTAADLIYGCIGVCGLTAVSELLLSWEWLIRLSGGILITAFGVMTFQKGAEKMAIPKGSATGKTSRGLLLLFLSSFFAAITNPATILAFLTAFASFGILRGVTVIQGCYLLCGLAIGTGSWWLFLAGMTSLLRRKISGRIFRILNQVLGILMTLFGIGAAAGGIL